MPAIQHSEHERTLASLWRAAGRRRLAHAISFEGPAGVGKFRAGLRLVAGLLCAQGPGAPCGSCGPCKRFAADSHPDLYVLDPEELELEQIPVHYMTPRPDHREVQSVEEFLALHAAEGGWRGVVLRDFDRANAAAQNALLKTLEEPRPSTLLLLESSQPDRLLPTIRSRCVRITLEALEPERARAVLEAGGVEAGAAAKLSRWCEGAPGRGFELLRQGALATRALLEQLLAGTLDPLSAAARMTEVEGEFAGRTDAARARMRLRAQLELALAVARDLRRAAAGVPGERLAHGDIALPRPVAEAAAAAALEALLDARQDVDANLAPEVVLERALLALAPLAEPHPTKVRTGA